MFKIKISLFCCTVLSLLSMPTLSPLSLQSLRGFKVVQNDYLNPITGYLAKTVVENIYHYGRENHPLFKAVHEMFHQISPRDPILPTKKGFFGKMVLLPKGYYNLGHLAALSSQPNSPEKTLSIKKLAQNCDITASFIRKQPLNLLKNITKKAFITHSKNKNEKTTIQFYDVHMPLLLLNAFAVSHATTKKEYLEFIQGFSENCCKEQKDWIDNTVNLTTVATKEWEQLRYTGKEYGQLCDKTFLNPSKNDLFYACAKQLDRIHWIPLEFDLPKLNNKPTKAQIGDCCESGIWAIVQLILSPHVNDVYNLALLPQIIQNMPLPQEFVKRFSDQSINDPVLRKEQFFVLSDPLFKQGRGKIVYDNPALYYEITSSAKNILNALNYFFGCDAKDFNQLGTALSSAGIQTVNFAITDLPQQNLQKIVVTVTDEATKKTGLNPGIRSTTLSVGPKHVQVIPTLTQETITPTTLLANTPFAPTSFPFSTCFETKTPGLNLFRSLSKNELNNVYHIWGQKEAKDLLLQKHIPILLDAKKLIYLNGDFDTDIIQLIAQQADKTPFKELIPRLIPLELVRMLKSANALFTFIDHVNPTWEGFQNSWIIGKIATEFLITKGPATTMLFLDKFYSVDKFCLPPVTTKSWKTEWKTDPNLNRELWKFFSEPQFDTGTKIINDSSLEFFEILLDCPLEYRCTSDAMLLPKYASIYHATKDLDLLVTLINKRQPWLGNNNSGAKFIPKLCDKLIKQTHNFDVVESFLNKLKPNWKTEKTFVKELNENINYDDFYNKNSNQLFVSVVQQYPDHTFLKPFFTLAPAAFTSDIGNKIRDINFMVKFLKFQKPDWETDPEFIKKLWEKIRWNRETIEEAFIKDPNNEFFKPFLTFHFIEFFKNNFIKELTIAQQLLNTYHPTWKTDKKMIKKICLCLPLETLGSQKNIDFDFLKIFFIHTPGHFIARLLREFSPYINLKNISLEKYLDFIEQICNKLKPGWTSDKPFLKKIWGKLKNDYYFSKLLNEKSEHPFCKLFDPHLSDKN